MESTTRIREIVRRGVARLIRWAVVESPGDDSGDFPTQTLRYDRHPGTKSAAIYPYGFSARAPSGSAAAILAFGDQENRGHVPLCTGPARYRGLKDGEVVVYNPLTRAKVLFKADGTIEATSPLDVSVTAGRNVTVSATTLVVQAATSVFSGNMIVTGTVLAQGAVTVPNLNVLGVADFAGQVLVDSTDGGPNTDLADHTHLQQNPVQQTGTPE